MWSEPHQGPNGFEKEGGSLRFQRRRDFILKERGGDEKGGRKILPDDARPGGHSKKDDHLEADTTGSIHSSGFLGARSANRFAV